MADLGGLAAARPRTVLQVLQADFPLLTLQNVKWCEGGAAQGCWRGLCLRTRAVATPWGCGTRVCLAVAAGGAADRAPAPAASPAGTYRRCARRRLPAAAASGAPGGLALPRAAPRALLPPPLVTAHRRRGCTCADIPVAHRWHSCISVCRTTAATHSSGSLDASEGTERGGQTVSQGPPRQAQQAAPTLTAGRAGSSQLPASTTVVDDAQASAGDDQRRLRKRAAAPPAPAWPLGQPPPVSWAAHVVTAAEERRQRVQYVMRSMRGVGAGAGRGRAGFLFVLVGSWRMVMWLARPHPLPAPAKLRPEHAPVPVLHLSLCPCRICLVSIRSARV